MTTGPETRLDTDPTAGAPPDVGRPLSLVRAESLGRTDPVLATTPVGTIDAAAIADVDGAGWVQLRGAQWSLDWWIGAEDRWHHPAREAAVRQRSLGDAPVLETAMRVPGGDVLHRAYGVRATSPGDRGVMWDDSAVLVELENSTAVPVAAALVVRPLTLGGDGRLVSVEVDGSVVRIDGRVAAVVSRPVARVAHGPVGSVAAALAAGEDSPATEVIGSHPDGRLEVALVVPLPHTAVVRVLLPRVAPRPRRRWFVRPAPVEPSGAFEAPDATAIGSGWGVHTRDAARAELGESLLDRVLPAAQRSLVLGSTDHVLDRADRAVQVAELLARSGLVEPLGPLARALIAAQRLGGAVELGDGGDAAAALLFAAAPLLAGGSEVWEELLVGPVAKVVHRAGGAGGVAGAGTPSASLSAALALVAPGLRRVGQPEVAAAALDAAATIGNAAVDDALGTGDTLLDQLVRLRGELAAGPTDVDAAVAHLMDLVRLGEPGSVGDRYDEDGTPVGALGYDPGAVAARASAVLDLVVRDDPDGPALAPVWSRSWWGRSVEAHRVLTRFGWTSFALRWHGSRPAVLWEVEPSWGVDPEAPPVVRAPALDPKWQARAWSGEALLGEVAPPENVSAAADTDAVPGLRITPTVVELPPAPGEGQSFQ